MTLSKVDETAFDLEVTGIHEQTPKELIQLFFENEKRSSGGPIAKLNFDPETGTAIISFEDKQGGNKLITCMLWVA